MLLLKLFLIPMLIKVLIQTGKPKVCAALYGACLFTNGLIFDVAFTGEWGRVLVILVGATGLSLLFFWLLNELESTGWPYWLTLVVGSAALLVLF
ncbi:MAG: hypothetical protein KC910_33365 [Candidatus Eremiobacteraeota bacterium]|nr:hypothetical protein [Candidatus Eremiobacteraeota bacterium]